MYSLEYWIPESAFLLSILFWLLLYITFYSEIWALCVLSALWDLPALWVSCIILSVPEPAAPLARVEHLVPLFLLHAQHCQSVLTGCPPHLSHSQVTLNDIISTQELQRKTDTCELLPKPDDSSGVHLWACHQCTDLTSCLSVPLHSKLPDQDCAICICG